MKILYLIPARGGSKGLPKKNIKILDGKPLINHTVEFARNFTDDANICISTDCDEIINCVNDINLKIEFKRPDNLSTDSAATIDVIIHAINYYESIGRYYDLVVLLQPTSPFRKIKDLKNMINSWTKDLDLLVSVKESHDSPYFNIFEENSNGFLEKSKDIGILRRQDGPKVYVFNGSLYLYNVASIKNKQTNIVKKYIMQDPISSIDIDTHFDFMMCENIIKNNLF